MIKLHYRRAIYLVASLAALLYCSIWLLELKMEKSIKENFLDLADHGEWSVTEKGNFWRPGKAWVLLSTTEDNYSDWFNEGRGFEYPTPDELVTLPNEARLLADKFNWDWHKYLTPNNEIVYFASSKYIGDTSVIESSGTKILVVITTL